MLSWDGIDFERTVPLIKHHQSIDSSRKDWERWRSCFDCSVALQSHCGGSHRSAHTLFCMKYWYICVLGGWQLRRRASCRNVLPILKNTFSPLYGAKCYKDGGTLNFNLCWLIINVFRWKYISAPAKVIIMNRKSFHKFSNTFLSWTEWQSAFEPELRTGTEASIDSP